MAGDLLPAKSPQMTAAEVNDFLAAEFPQIFESGFDLKVEEIGEGSALTRLSFSPRHLRPGGTISGPAMFALADVCMYACVLAHYGPLPLAVTINLNINFMRRPDPADLLASARLLKQGRRFATGDIAIHAEGDDRMVAHATATYALPAERQVS